MNIDKMATVRRRPARPPSHTPMEAIPGLTPSHCLYHSEPGRGHLYFSKALGLENLPAVRRAGVRRIVAMDPTKEIKSRWAAHNNARVYTPFQLGNPETEPSDLRRLHRTARGIARDVKAGRSVLIHCTEGMQRSPVLGYFALVELGRDPDEALKEFETHTVPIVKNYRPLIERRIRAINKEYEAVQRRRSDSVLKRYVELRRKSVGKQNA